MSLEDKAFYVNSYEIQSRIDGFPNPNYRFVHYSEAQEEINQLKETWIGISEGKDLVIKSLEEEIKELRESQTELVSELLVTIKLFLDYKLKNKVETIVDQGHDFGMKKALINDFLMNIDDIEELKNKRESGEKKN